MIRDFIPRLYQQTILGTVAQFNTLVVLPTGLGKTALAFLIAAQRLSLYPNSKILMLAPTKPLCEQHVKSFQTHLNIRPDKIVLFTGTVKPKKREELWKIAQIIISTPQGLENDVINRRVKLEEVSCLVFDEAHHATGDYSYVWLAQQYDKISKHSRILALTASPGSDLEKVHEVCTNLKIEKLEVRTEKDVDVKPYVQNIKKNWVKVDLPENFKKIQRLLQTSRKAKLIEVQKYGYCNDTGLNKTGLLTLQREFQKRISSGEREFELMRSISLIAEALKVDHALELLESQGIFPLNEYFNKLKSESLTSKVKAVKNLMLDPSFKSAMHLNDNLIEKGILHPKQIKLIDMVQETIEKNNQAKLIIFTQFRDSAGQISKGLEELGIKGQIFVGQAKKKGIGFSQKKQKEILDKFRNGEFNILIATSVAEEGLDIPKVDEVIFYEPVPSAIRSIQRRGRTGRLEEGEVTILLTTGTRDEGYRWSAHHKEKRMYRNLEKLRKGITLVENKQENQTLNKFIKEDEVVTILADHREKDNKIVKELIDLGVAVKTAQLESADYLVSGKVGVELKKVPDFVASMIDGRILEQVRDLKNNFEKAILIIEGDEDIYSVRKVHANAIRGMLSSIVLDFQVPIIYTKNPKDTAAILAIMAKREQNKDKFDYSLHTAKPRNEKEQQEFIVSSFPGIGRNTAKILLENLGSVKNLVNSNEKELSDIKGIGKKISESLFNIFNKKYEKK